MMKKIFFIFILIFLSGCGANLTLPDELKNSSSPEPKKSKSKWWSGYKNKKINDFVDLVLKDNTELKIARLNWLANLARADLIRVDFYPTLGAQLGASQGLDLGSKKLNSASLNMGLSLNYELDLFGKISAEAGAAEFSARASADELDALRLSLINSTLNYIFELAYFNDVEELLRDYISNLTELKKLYEYKVRMGKIEGLDLINTEQSLLKAQQNLLTNEQNKNLLLKNLSSLSPGKNGEYFLKYFSKISLSNFSFLKTNFKIPLSSLRSRPDVRAKENKLLAAFKNANAVSKSLLPSLSLGASLANQNGGFSLSFLGGNLNLSLPFLDYARVRQNIKISELEYEKTKLEYEVALSAAINELWLNEKDYKSAQKILENAKKIVSKQRQIAKAYEAKYEAGKSEFKDALDAMNALNSAQQDLLRARFNLFKIINLFYQLSQA